MACFVIAGVVTAWSFHGEVMVGLVEFSFHFAVVDVPVTIAVEVVEEFVDLIVVEVLHVVGGAHRVFRHEGSAIISGHSEFVRLRRSSERSREDVEWENTW